MARILWLGLWVACLPLLTQHAENGWYETLGRVRQQKNMAHEMLHATAGPVALCANPLDRKRTVEEETRWRHHGCEQHARLMQSYIYVETYRQYLKGTLKCDGMACDAARWALTAVFVLIACMFAAYYTLTTVLYLGLYATHHLASGYPALGSKVMHPPAKDIIHIKKKVVEG